MKQIKKIENRLNTRTKAYESMVNSSKHESKVSMRIASGGYARPGSRNKKA